MYPSEALFRINTLRAALQTSEGIDAIMKHKPEEGEDFRSFLEKYARRASELSEYELFALTIIIGIKRK